MSYLQNQINNFNASVVASASRLPPQKRGAGGSNLGTSSSTTSTPQPSTPAASADVKKKRQDVDIVYSQPANTGTGKEIMTQVFFAIDYMKTKDVPLTFEDITSYLSLQARAHDQGYMHALRRILQSHEKVDYDPRGSNGQGTYKFRPPFDIRSPEMLLKKFQSQKTAQGVNVRELREGWPNVEEAIDQMEKEGKLLVTRNKKDNHAKMVWPNDTSLIQHFDDEFRQIWEKIKIPDHNTVREELEKAGITPTSKNKEVNTKPKVEQRKVKKPRRSGKTTNTHMMGILRDYSHLKR